jgi:hypothetical protein
MIADLFAGTMFMLAFFEYNAISSKSVKTGKLA